MSAMTSENRKLYDLASALAHELKRPICSTDLNRYLEVHPVSRPVLTQRLGQLLLKAARPAKTGIPRLRQVGLYGYHAYYAPDADPIWEVRFAEFRNCEDLVLFYRLHFLGKVRYLVGGPHDALVRHSLAGWLVEAELLMGRCPTHPLNIGLIHQRDQVQPLAAGSFTTVIPADLLPRSTALSLLQRSMVEHASYRRTIKINHSRYLSVLKWPQSHLYPSLPALMYSDRQLQAFLVSRWPQDHENEEEAYAVRWALRYPDTTHLTRLRVDEAASTSNHRKLSLGVRINSLGLD